MNENGPHSTAGLAEDTIVRPLHDCACYLMSIARLCLERLTHLPFPIGIFIAGTEGLLGWLIRPFSQRLRVQILSILASIDDQMFALVEGCGLYTKDQVRAVLTPLCTHGLIGGSAVVWVKYEGAIEDKLRKATHLASRIPIICLVTPLLSYLINPSARAISDWLKKQAERQPDVITPPTDHFLLTVKGIDPPIIGAISKFEGRNPQNEQSAHSQGSEIRRNDVLLKGDMFNRQDQLTDGRHEEKRVNIDDTLRAIEGAITDDHPKDDVPVPVPEEHEPKCISVKGITEDDANKSMDELESGTSFAHVDQEGMDPLFNILEMLESTWSLGSRSFKESPSSSQRRLR